MVEDNGIDYVAVSHRCKACESREVSVRAFMENNGGKPAYGVLFALQEVNTRG